jgi:hypothetical protein
MMHRRSLMLAAGGLDIADAFSTDLYTGNGGTQTITNGIDLSGEGGMVWSKARSNTGYNVVVDTDRGASRLYTNTTAAGDSYDLLDFNSDGYTLKTAGQNSSGYTYAGWTFRKTPKFFDVVTYTGTGGDDNAGRYIDHSLESIPGMIIVKRTDSAQDWTVGHQTYPYYYYLSLNKTDAQAGGGVTGKGYVGMGNDTQFFISNGGSTSIANDLNTSGATYVAYLFAHDTEDDGVIQCGSYTGNGSATGPVVNLGWEAQWVLIKQSSGTTPWYIMDTERRAGGSPEKQVPLSPNTSGAEGGTGLIEGVATGFQLVNSGTGMNGSGGTYIYMAIRKEGA